MDFFYWCAALYDQPSYEITMTPNLQSQSPVVELVLFHPDMKIDGTVCHQQMDFSLKKKIYLYKWKTFFFSTTDYFAKSYRVIHRYLDVAYRTPSLNINPLIRRSSYTLVVSDWTRIHLYTLRSYSGYKNG